jgi:hypothetical protein
MQNPTDCQHCQWVNLKDLPTWGKKRQPKHGKGLVFFKVAPFVQYVSCRFQIVVT